VLRRIVDWLRCPECRWAPLSLDAESDADDIVDGTLRCRGCGGVYWIEGGIPFLLPAALRERVDERSARAAPEEFAEYQTEATPAVARLVAKLAAAAGVVLDIGSGRGPYLPFFSGEVICLDIYPQFLRDLPESVDGVTVHAICASATHVPIRPGVADLVFASSLIEHLPPAETQRALREWPRLANQWCAIDAPNGYEGAWLTRLRHLVYRTETLTEAAHPDLPELDHHSTFSPDDFRAAGFECHGCIGWVSRMRFPLGPVWDLFDAVAWRFPAIGGTLVAVSPGRLNRPLKSE
jgi:uncharacterized protein YbaR (Trm112 family)